MPRTAIPSTSASACICQWRGNALGLSPERCSALADAFRLRRLGRVSGSKGVMRHANTSKAKSRSRGSELGRSELGRGQQWFGEYWFIGTILISTILIATIRSRARSRSSVLVCLPTGVAPRKKTRSLSGACCRIGRFRSQDPPDRGDDASPWFAPSAEGKPGRFSKVKGQSWNGLIQLSEDKRNGPRAA